MWLVLVRTTQKNRIDRTPKLVYIAFTYKFNILVKTQQCKTQAAECIAASLNATEHVNQSANAVDFL